MLIIMSTKYFICFIICPPNQLGIIKYITQLYPMFELFGIINRFIINKSNIAFGLL